VPAQEEGIGPGAVALGEHEPIAADNLVPRDTPLRAVANDERARAGEIAQRFEDALAPHLLYDGDRDRCRREDQQDQSFGEIATRR
jgi:hypothetical protein